jgi:hypothetical protein
MTIFKKSFYFISFLIYLWLFFCIAFSYSALMKMSATIPFEDVASGGNLLFCTLVNRNPMFITVETKKGESAETVVRRIAEGMTDPNIFPTFRKIKKEQRDSTINRMASGNKLNVPGISGEYFIAGTEKGLGIPDSPVSLSCSWNKKTNIVNVNWGNPIGYNFIQIRWTYKDNWVRDHLPENTTFYNIDVNERRIDPNNTDIWLIGYVNGEYSDPNYIPPLATNYIPSGAAAIHLAGNIQEEIFGIPFKNNITPNWLDWSIKDNSEDVEFKQGKRKVSSDPLIMIKSADSKPFYQIITTKSANVKAGIYRKFLGLTAGHTYRLSTRLNTLEMDKAANEWSFSLNAVPIKGDTDLTVSQMAGIDVLPDGKRGESAGRMVSFGPKNTTKGNWIEHKTAKGEQGIETTDITLPEGTDAIFVWLRCSGQNASCAMDWIKLDDLSQ